MIKSSYLLVNNLARVKDKFPRLVIYNSCLYGIFHRIRFYLKIFYHGLFDSDSIFHGIQINRERNEHHFEGTRFRFFSCGIGIVGQ